MFGNKLFENYVKYELLYETKMKNKYDLKELYPKYWYRIFDYQLKIDILREALEKNILIIDAKGYQIPQE